MNPLLEHLQLKTRRYFLQQGALGLGAIAMQSLAGPGLAQAATAGTHIQQPHFPAKAKRIIYLHMTGSPPNLDMYDYKPELLKRHGENCPQTFLAGKEFAFTSGTPTLLGSPQKFQRVGQAGTWMSSAIPHLHNVANEMCLVHSMHSDQFNHAPAELLIYTGSPRAGRPSMGAWLSYGLGSENDDLPAFVVLISSGVQPNGGKSSFGSGFLPSVYQGIQCRSKGDPVLFASNPPGMNSRLRRQTLDTLHQLNQLQVEAMGHPETQTRISQYELAYRMQTSVPEVMDISHESKSTLDDYGAQPGESSLANNCLLARRLIESGVRFVQLFDWGWDYHGTSEDQGIGDGLVRKCATMDKPISALIRDLRQRGLLEDTLIVWGGEFGRTPFREGRTAKSAVLGRDHYPDCFTMWLAGGGVKGGFDYGTTDELGFGVAEKPVHVHDLQATILHLMGFDHTRLTYRFQGRDYRLTDVHGEVVHDLIA